MMDRISAGNNLSVDIQQNQWRLLANGDGAENVLLEARPGQPLRYVSTFGRQRRLPISGALSLEDVDRVVLGWSNRNGAWHLGLMLKPELSETRGSRWCGLVYWSDPDTSLYRDSASKAGEALAQQLNLPFTLIPPHVSESAAPIAPAAAPLMPSIPSIAPPVKLPIKLDQWTLRRTENPALLELELSAAWGRSRLLRVAWYIVWAGVFVVLSVSSLTSGIALPQPEFLPYAGLAAAIFLILLSIATIIGVMRRTKRIEIDGRMRTVSGMRGRRARWRFSTDQLNGVYATHLVSRVNRRKQARQVHYGEINLYGRDGKFFHLLSQGQTDEKLPISLAQPASVEHTAPTNSDLPDRTKIIIQQENMRTERIVPLTAENAFTHLQAATLLIAQTLQLPAWFDQRMK